VLDIPTILAHVPLDMLIFTGNEVIVGKHESRILNEYVPADNVVAV
jgi:hypothetical protein